MVRNLTPHSIRIILPEGDPRGQSALAPDRSWVWCWELAPDPAGPARVAGTSSPSGAVDGIPTARTVWGIVDGLPAPAPGVTLIVSALVAGRPEMTDRQDVWSPGTGPQDGAVRYPDGPQKGQVWAVTRLVRP